MSSRKLKVDTKKMLGFRLLKESAKTSSTQSVGSKVGNKAVKPMNSMIGGKTVVKPMNSVSSILSSKVGNKRA